MKVLISMALALLFLENGYSQSPALYKSRWLTKPAFGRNIPLTNFLGGYETDHLINYSDKSYYWQIFSTTYFFHKHWGVEANFMSNSTETYDKRIGKFINIAEAEYGNKYFVSPFMQGIRKDRSLPLQSFLGLVFRYEYNRVYINPKISCGLLSISANQYILKLKEKDANTLLETVYNPERPGKDFLILAPALSAGYKLTSRVFINTDLQACWSKTSFTYTKTVTNLFTSEKSQHKNIYSQNLRTISIGAGIIIVLI